MVSVGHLPPATLLEGHTGCSHLRKRKTKPWKGLKSPGSNSHSQEFIQQILTEHLPLACTGPGCADVEVNKLGLGPVLSNSLEPSGHLVAAFISCLFIAHPPYVKCRTVHLTRQSVTTIILSVQPHFADEQQGQRACETCPKLIGCGVRFDSLPDSKKPPEHSEP